MIKKQLTIRFTAILFLICLSGFTSNAQSTFPTLGGDVIGSGGSLSYTVGQLAVSFDKQKAMNAEVVKTSLYEGVQQTYSVEELRIVDVQPIETCIHIYPNPSTDRVTVTIENIVENMHLELYTVNGQLLQREPVCGTEQTIDIKDYPSGSYLLRLSVGDKENNYRIIKIR